MVSDVNNLHPYIEGLINEAALAMHAAGGGGGESVTSPALKDDASPRFELLRAARGVRQPSAAEVTRGGTVVVRLARRSFLQTVLAGETD